MAKTGAEVAIAIARADHRAWHNRGSLTEREHREMRQGLVRSYFAEERRWPNWCAAFVAHALETAGVPVPRKGAPRRGAQALTRWVAEHGHWVYSPPGLKHDIPDGRYIRPGDIICWRRPPLGWRGHVALILRVLSVEETRREQVDRTGQLILVKYPAGCIEIAEGNSTDEQGRNGQLVIRTISSTKWPTRMSGLYGVVRPNYGGTR